jgi:hypothetical protein
VLERFINTFPAKSIQRPKQHSIELPSGCGLEHGKELFAVATLPAGMVRKLPADCPVLFGTEILELPELILNVLALSQVLTRL